LDLRCDEPGWLVRCAGLAKVQCTIYSRDCEQSGTFVWGQQEDLSGLKLRRESVVRWRATCGLRSPLIGMTFSESLSFPGFQPTSVLRNRSRRAFSLRTAQLVGHTSDARLAGLVEQADDDGDQEPEQERRQQHVQGLEVAGPRFQARSV
jgi:hypothetical protein